MRMAHVRVLMAEQEYGAALKEVDRTCKSEDDALCLLERGLLLHYTGNYDESNQVFDRAEILVEDLYTKSLSREAAAFITSDLAREYVPRPFEQVLINYFRALNYVFLGLDEDALVECRKASDKLARYSEDAKRPYRQDAFLEYLTGILYEWGGETNSAFISYRNAREAYRTYAGVFGVTVPRDLPCDVLRTAEALGFAAEIDSVSPEAQRPCWALSAANDSAGDASAPGLPGPDRAKIVVLIEQGFVPARQEMSLNVPILKSERDYARDDPFGFSLGLAPRMYHGYYDADDIDYFLRIALPYYPDLPPVYRAPDLYIDSLLAEPAEAEDVFAIARAELEADMPIIFARTLARAVVKYQVTNAARHRWGEIFGKLVNFATAATEQADLRAWLSLPRAIYIAVIYAEPGPHTLAIAATSHGSAGGLEDFQEIQLETKPGSTNFVRFRQY